MPPTPAIVPAPNLRGAQGRWALRDPYTLDFLSLGADAHERDIERGPTDHIRAFLLEMGVGCAYVGSQYHRVELTAAEGATLGEGGNRMDQPPHAPSGSDGFPPPLTPERLRQARERVAEIRERIRRRGVDLAQLPDPVEELSRARERGSWE